MEYIPEPWRSQYFTRNARDIDPGSAMLYLPPGDSKRPDLHTPHGVGGSNPGVVEQQLLVDLAVDYAVLGFLYPRLKVANPLYETAMCRALNDFMAATWLSKYNWHGRYRGSIRVCPFDPDGAVREIERWAGHPYICQVSIFPETSAPYGQPQFAPILEAAARHRLPIGMHIINQVGMRLLTPVGFPSYWNEEFAQHPLIFMGHIASLVFGGAFERLPDLKIVCIEGGFSWLAPFMWRLDRRWRALGGEVPEVRRSPSEQIRDHVRLTTQPLEEPAYHRPMHRLMEWMDAGRMLLLATDYPHYDSDPPEWTAARLPEPQRDRILFENALDLYGLSRTRPATELDERPRKSPAHVPERGVTPEHVPPAQED